MKYSLRSKLLCAALSAAMLLTTPVGMVKAAAEDDEYTGKYIHEVFIAYGETEEEARNWLTTHGWEPVSGDFNAGKEAGTDDAVAAVMGIHRTNSPDAAITDMAVMNMKGGYSFDDYESLLRDKEAEINEFVDSFMPVIQEYRDNYNGKGSEVGKIRAQKAHELLNKYYDGDIDGEYAVHDTGMLLGDLLLKQTRREIGELKYELLSKNEQVQYGDLQQILLESSGTTLLAIQEILALASDAGKDSWSDRLAGYSGLTTAELAESVLDNVGELSDSAAKSKLMTTYGDAAASLAGDYLDVQQELQWYMAYRNLLSRDGDTETAYNQRCDAHFRNLKEQNEEQYFAEASRYALAELVFRVVFTTEYEGEWGATLGDFFLPENAYTPTTEDFLPLAVSLSEGQRAGLKFLPLLSLLRISTGNDAAALDALKNTEGLPEDVEAASVYTGQNRAIFRKGVALTSRALMERNLGKDPYDQWIGYDGYLQAIVLSTALISAVTVLVGASMAVHAERLISKAQATYQATKASLIQSSKAATQVLADNGSAIIKIQSDIGLLRIQRTAYNTMLPYMKTADDAVKLQAEVARLSADIEAKETSLNSMIINSEKASATKKANNLDQLGAAIEKDNEIAGASRLSANARLIMGVGGALLLAAAVVEAVNLGLYYNRDMTPIPMMIVDEADIVSYVTDENGNPVFDKNGRQKKNIDFNQFVYYEVVRCNRQDIGINDEAQDGVEEYAASGCGDAADLNADIGKQWLALYTVKSSAKGFPILADSLTVQTGSNSMPSKCNGNLHFFTYNYAADLADEAFCYDNEKNGIYLFWKSDEKAYTASSFTTGQMALAGIGGLAAGILGASAVMFLTRKRKDTPDTPAAA